MEGARIRVEVVWDELMSAARINFDSLKSQYRDDIISDENFDCNSVIENLYTSHSYFFLVFNGSYISFNY